MEWEPIRGVFLMMDAAYLAQVIDEHARALTLYARQWSDAPEDIVQEAFIRLAAQKDPPERTVPWLFRVVRNLAISHVRSMQRRRRHEEQAALRRPSWFVPTPETALDGAAVTAALKGLPRETREVVTLHLWAGLTFAEIADVVGSSTTSVHRLYSAGLCFLRERLHVPCPRDQTKN